MRVLLTGGAGYIGSILSRELLERGYDVVIVDRLFFGDDPIKDIKDQVKIIREDIRTVDPKHFENVDVVVDLAALSNDPSGELDPNLTEAINHLGRTRIAKISKEKGVKRYIAPSSCAIYGVSDGFADENSPVNPLTAYAKANYAWENDILPLKDKNFTVVILRQATVYGFSYRMRLDLLINDFVVQAIKNRKIVIKGNGEEFRPFVHVKDDSNAIIAAIEADSEIVNGERFNVGSNHQNVQVKELMRLIPETLGIEIEQGFGDWIDKRNYKVKFDKIQKLLNFEPKYEIKDGIHELHKALEDGLFYPDDARTVTVKWYKNLLAQNPNLFNL